MKVGIVGAGKVGTSFALLLNKYPFEISGVYSRTDESAQLLNSRLSRISPNCLEFLVENSDVVLICVTDSEISAAVEKIAALSESVDLSQKCFMHLSGALSSEVLKPLKDLKANTGSLHPVETFPTKNKYKKINDIFMTFEGDEIAEQIASMIAHHANSRMMMISSENKPLYHAAACVISNYSAVLAQIVFDFFHAAGIVPEDGFEMLMPLWFSTLENIYLNGIQKSISGPIARGDAETIQLHMDSIDSKVKEDKQLYSLLGKKLCEIVRENHMIMDEKAKEIMDVLDR